MITCKRCFEVRPHPQPSHAIEFESWPKAALAHSVHASMVHARAAPLHSDRSSCPSTWRVIYRHVDPRAVLGAGGAAAHTPWSMHIDHWYGMAEVSKSVSNTMVHAHRSLVRYGGSASSPSQGEIAISGVLMRVHSAGVGVIEAVKAGRDLGVREVVHVGANVLDESPDLLELTLELRRDDRAASDTLGS